MVIDYIELSKVTSARAPQLKPGMGWALYTDDGPSGPCAQCMSVTCPHAYLYLFETEEDLRKSLGRIGRQGNNAQMRYGVIGSWGQMRVIKVGKGESV